MQKRWIVGILFLAVIGLLAGCNNSLFRETLTDTGKIPVKTKLYVETFNGDVIVAATQGTGIEVEMEYWASGSNKTVVNDFLKKREMVVTGVTEGDLAKIIASRKNPTEPNPTGLLSYGVNMTVKVPAEIVKNLEVVTSNGIVRIEGVKGTTAVSTSNGQVTVNNAIGNISIANTNGTISIHNIQGNLAVDASNSAVSVTTAKLLQNVLIRTSQGKVSYQSQIDEVNGNYDIETSNDSLEMFLGKSIKASFNAETSNGSIICDLPVTDVNPEPTILEGTLNGGGASIKLKTSNGNIVISNTR